MTRHSPSVVERVARALGEADAMGGYGDFSWEHYAPDAEAALNASGHSELVEALAPFVDIGPQKGAWGAIDKRLDSLAPLTVTVTKAQMLAAFAAFTKAK